MPGFRRLRLLVVALVLGGAPRLHAATVPSVLGGRIACAPSTGDVQLCVGSVATRVESFDGVPLDVNLTIPPATMDGPFPLIVDHHGWSLGKTPTPYVSWAQLGYVVLSYTARGLRGPRLGVPVMPLADGPITTQPVSDDPNGCWGASLTRSKSTAHLVRAAARR